MLMECFTNETKNILVFGTGKICEKYRKSLERMNVLAFLDNDRKKQGTMMWGKEICEPREGIIRFAFEKIFIMTVAFPEIVLELENIGVDKTQIDTYLSIDDKLGEPIFKDKYPKFAYDDIRKAVQQTVAVFPDDFSVLEIFKCFSRKMVIIENGVVPDGIDVIAYHGFSMTEQKAEIYQDAVKQKIPTLFFEDGFLRSILPCGFQSKAEYVIGRSIILDGRGLYINAFSESEIERMLNSKFALSQAEKDRATRLIEFIVNHHLSKYNYQPIVNISIGRETAAKVLVIDQVPGDKSIKYGLAQEETFAAMLETAIMENPDADILIKCHPATQRSHYKNIDKKHVYIIDYPINPITLLSYVDKVYVCTSQMGFEALMCGREVHVFGMPFYAGWGVTHDRMHCPRRTKKRTIEEIFFAAYIAYSTYVSYKKNSVCEIEQAIDELLEQREEYWAEQAKK